MSMHSESHSLVHTYGNQIDLGDTDRWRTLIKTYRIHSADFASLNVFVSIGFVSCED